MQGADGERGARRAVMPAPQKCRLPSLPRSSRRSMSSLLRLHTAQSLPRLQQRQVSRVRRAQPRLSLTPAMQRQSQAAPPAQQRGQGGPPPWVKMTGDDRASVEAPPIVPAVVRAPAQPRQGARTALLIVMPGAMLGPKDYEPLLAAIQGHASESLDVWAAVPHIDWQHVVTAIGFENLQQWTAYSDGLIRAAVAAACEQGFPLLGRPEARMENVFVAMHSLASSFYPGVPMKHSAGAILLGSVIDGTACPSVPDVAAAPRSVMHILGAMDGQMRLPRGAWVAAHLASLAAQFGPRHFAQVRPFAVVPGMNHAQFCNGVVNTMRGDVASDIPLETQSEAVAGLVADFMAANHPEATEESSHHALERLLQATTASFDLLTPFSEAAGRGSPSALLCAGASSAADVALNEVEARSFGAEKLSGMSPHRNGFSHVGELEAAERFARSAQRAMLAAGMPAGADLSAVRLAVTSHTHLDSFIFSQPVIFPTETPAGKEWVVHAHVYLHWECYQPGMESLAKPLSPQYIMKLKKGAALAHAMGLEGGRPEGVISGGELNEQTYKEALAASPALFKESFAAHGKPLAFAPDRDMTKEVTSPVDWINTLPTLEPGPDGKSIVLTSPSVSTPLAPSPAYDRGAGRFSGCHYIKAMSPAWMHEWVMIEGLRH